MRNIIVIITATLALTPYINAEDYVQNQTVILNPQNSENLEAIRLLDNALVIAQKIKDVDAKYALIKELEHCKKCFQSNSDKNNLESIANRAIYLSENIDELLAECGEEDLHLQIASCMQEMAACFENEEAPISEF